MKLYKIPLYGLCPSSLFFVTAGASSTQSEQTRAIPLRQRLRHVCCACHRSACTADCETNGRKVSLADLGLSSTVEGSLILTTPNSCCISNSEWLYFSLLFKNKNRLIKSPVCVFVCVCVCLSVCLCVPH
jgi:hypothetical protein